MTAWQPPSIATMEPRNRGTKRWGFGGFVSWPHVKEWSIASPNLMEGWHLTQGVGCIRNRKHRNNHTQKKHLGREIRTCNCRGFQGQTATISSSLSSPSIFSSIRGSQSKSDLIHDSRRPLLEGREEGSLSEEQAHTSARAKYTCPLLTLSEVPLPFSVSGLGAR